MAPKQQPKEKDANVKVKINQWNGSAVKNSLDDAVRGVLTGPKLNYQEQFRLIDTRLAMCAIAVGVATFAVVWDFFNPFPQSRNVLIICVISYFVMMGFLTLFVTYWEEGIFVIAQNKETKLTWEASSDLPKYHDEYHLSLVIKDGKTGNTREAHFVKSVANFFDSNGILLSDLIETEVLKLHNSLLMEKKEK